MRSDRRVRALFWVAVFVAMAVFGVAVWWAWLTQTNFDIDGKLLFIGFLCPLCIFAVPGGVKTAFSPNYAIVGANGFATFGGEPILWSDVTGIRDRTYRSKTVGLTLTLARPLKMSRTRWVGNLFGLLNFLAPQDTVGLPKGLSPIPFDQLRAMFLEHFVDKGSPTLQQASTHWPA